MALREADSSNPYEQLNDIASRRSRNDFCPEEVTRDALEAICDEIQDDIDSAVEKLVTGTFLTRRQAQVYVLRETPTPESLTQGAIGVFLGVVEGRETPVVQQTVSDAYNTAEEKLEKARQTMWALTTTSAEETLSHPQITWLEHQTLDELRSRASEDDQTIDDVVTRLLDRTQSTIALREFLETLVDEKDVADVQVGKALLKEGHTLQMTITMPHSQIDEGRTPKVLKPHDRITIDGRQFQFNVDESAMGPGGVANAITLYAADNIREIDPVSIDEGIEALRAFLDEDREKA